jgi:hypothetical protein
MMVKGKSFGIANLKLICDLRAQAERRFAAS